MRVLSIDGGGVRGAAVAAYLVELEAALPEGESILSFFDAFAGTSTGALIVGALVYGKLTAIEICDSLYSLENIRRVMPPSMMDLLFGIVQTEAEYDGIGKRQVIDDHVSSEVNLCDTEKKVVITWTDIDRERPRLSVSWDKTGKVKVRDVVDASSAAPGYFPYVEFEGYDGELVRGVDGALFANNPTDLVTLKLMECCDPDTPMQILSIGTGYVQGTWKGDKIHQNAGGIPWLVTGNLMGLIFDTPKEMVDYRMKTMADTFPIKYVRVHGPVENDSLDDTCDKNIESLKSRGKRVWWPLTQERVHSEIISCYSQDKEE